MDAQERGTKVKPRKFCRAVSALVGAPQAPQAEL